MKATHKMTPKTKTTPKIRTTPKMKIAPKRKRMSFVGEITLQKVKTYSRGI